MLRLKKIENDLNQLRDLLDLCFCVSKGGHFFDDFPIWDPQYNVLGVSHFGFYFKKDLIACACFRVAELRNIAEKSHLKIGLIGAVVTHPQWRSRGLASQLIEKLLRKAIKEKVVAVFLWASDPGFYRKWGFESYGNQVRIPLTAFDHLTAHSSQEVLIKKNWNRSLFDFIRQEKIGLILKEEDRTWFSAHRNVEWYFTQNDIGVLTAYSAVGRGIDLPLLVHEWGGNPEHLRMIWSYLRERKEGLSLLSLPGRLRVFGISDEVISHFLEPLCLARFFVNTPEISLLSNSIWLGGLDSA